MKKICLAFLLLICLLVAAACSSPMKSSKFAGDMPAAPSPATATSDVMYQNDYVAYETELSAAVESGGYGGAAGLPAGVEARKVVTSAEFRILTDDFGGAMRRLEQKIAVSGGYIQQSDSRAATEYRPAFASMTIRVPASLYGDFKSFLSDLAELDSSSEHGEDVTVQYYDTEARLKVLQAQEERIKTFIANSKDLDEIFKIERELTRISTEIEQLTTVKNRLDNLTAYATVYVEIHEIAEVKVVEAVTFGEKINNALQGSLMGVTTGAQSLLLLIIWCWPLLLLTGVALLIWRKFAKRRAKPTDKNIQPPTPQEEEK